MNIQRFWIVIFLVTSQKVFADDSPEIITLTDDNPTITWKQSDSPSIVVAADLGYQIQMNVTKMSLDGETGDYTIVKINRDDNDEYPEDGLMFTYTVPGQPVYLFNHNEVSAEYLGKNEMNIFEISFTRAGEALATTTTSTTTSTTPRMPTASPDEDDTLTVYVRGLTNFNTFKTALVAMAKEYCNDKECPLQDEIVIGNVNLKIVTACPLSWANNENCQNVTFSLPILKNEKIDYNTIFDGYQLNTKNLRNMWDEYAEKHLKANDLDIYSEPDMDEIFTFEIVTACLVVVILVLIILLLRAYLVRRDKKRSKIENLDTSRNSKGPYHRISETSLNQLKPHYLQVLPPFLNSEFQSYQDQKASTFPEVDESVPESPEVSNVALFVGSDLAGSKEADV